MRTEWRLLMATHDLTKLHRHQLAAAAICNGRRDVHTIAGPERHSRSRSFATASRQSRSRAGGLTSGRLPLLMRLSMRVVGSSSWRAADHRRQFARFR